MLDLNAVVFEEDPEALSMVGGESRVESSLDAEEGGSGCEFSSMCLNEAESGTSASLVVNAATAEAISPDCEASSQIGKPFSPSYSTRQFFPLEPMDYPLLAPAPFPFPSLSPSPATATATAPAPPTPEFLAKNSQGLPQGIRPAKKSRRGPRSRSSQYRGVTFYRRTGRWESHIWDCGKQIYLGGFNTAHDAARAYDRAAIKFRGLDADINFNLGDYEEDMKQMAGLNKEEFVRALRRQSTGFSRRSSKYTGVTLHKCGRWEARIGPFSGKKYIYLGIFDSEVEAARAYDKAALHCNGQVAMTNFDQNTYEKELLLNGGGDIGMDVVVNFGASPRYKSGTGENTKGLAGPNMARIQGACIGGAQQMEGSIGKEEGKMQPSEGLPLMQPPSLYPTAFAPWHQWFLSTGDGQAQRSFLPPHRFISMGTENPYMQALAHPVEESSLVSKVATGLASSGGMGMKAPLEMGGETSWATKNGPMAASSGFSVQKTTTGFTWLHGSYHKPQSGACVPTCVASNPAMETSSHGPRQVELCLSLSLNSFNKT